MQSEIKKHEIINLNYQDWLKVNKLFGNMGKNIWIYINQVNRFKDNIVEISLLDSQFKEILRVNEITYEEIENG